MGQICQITEQKRTQTINLADVQSGAVKAVTFNVTFDPSLAGTTQTITATIDPGNVLKESNFTNNTASVQVKVVSTLTISDVHVTQVVRDFTLPGSTSDADLVLGKSTLVEATVSAIGFSPTDATPVTVTATFSDGTTGSQTITIGDAIQNKTKNKVKILPLVPNAPGASVLTVTATAPNILDATPITKNLRIKPTNSLGVVYSTVSNPLYGQVSQSDAAVHATQSDLFMQGVYPVAENGIIDPSSGTFKYSDLAGSDIIPLWLAAPYDLATICLERTLTDPTARNGVGIVPSGYFPFHLSPDAKGISYLFWLSKIGLSSLIPGCSLVANEYWTTTAHEIGHTFGLSDLPLGSPLLQGGYWVDRFQSRSNKSDLMSVDSSISLATLYNDWISSDEFSTLFQGLQTNPSDPEVTVIAGMISKNGTINILPTYFLAHGVSTPYNAAADGVVTSFAQDGTVAATASFASSYNLVTNIGAVIPTDTSVFIVQIPASNATSIQVQQAGVVLATFNPQSQLLIDAIKSIPNSSFREEPSETRHELLEQAKSVEKSIKHCNLTQPGTDPKKLSELSKCEMRAVNHVLELMEQISHKLNESTQKTSPLQMVKADVLRTLDAVTLHLIPSVYVRSHEHSFKIQVLPAREDKRQEKDLFKIVSFTQRENGSVSINRDQTISYKPLGAPKGDRFAITIQNLEGILAVKQVNIIPPSRPTDSDHED